MEIYPLYIWSESTLYFVNNSIYLCYLLFFSFFYFSQKYFGEFQRKQSKKGRKYFFAKKKKKTKSAKMTLLQNALFSVFRKNGL